MFVLHPFAAFSHLIRQVSGALIQMINENIEQTAKIINGGFIR
jgi:hypothetical protein